MAIDDLLAGIEKEAEEEREAILGRARTEAAAIVEEAERGARARAEVAASALEGELRAVARERLRDARLEALTKVSAARERMVEQIVAGARKRLLEMCRGVEGDRVLSLLLVEGLRYVGPGQLEVRCAPVDADRMRRSMPPGIGERAAVIPDATISEGLRIVARDGRLEVRASLGDRLEGAVAELAGRIVHEVEEERTP